MNEVWVCKQQGYPKKVFKENVKNGSVYAQIWNDEWDNVCERSIRLVDLLRRKEMKMGIGVDKVIDYAEKLIQGKGLDLHSLYPEELYEHCKNVAILSVGLGFLYRLNFQEILDLGVGSLLHDIGKILKMLIKMPLLGFDKKETVLFYFCKVSFGTWGNEFWCETWFLI